MENTYIVRLHVRNGSIQTDDFIEVDESFFNGNIPLGNCEAAEGEAIITKVRSFRDTIEKHRKETGFIRYFVSVEALKPKHDSAYEIW